MQSTPCLICSHYEVRRVYRNFGLDIVRCASCGFVFVNPRPDREDVRTRYNDDYFCNEYLPAHGVVGGRYEAASFGGRYRPVLELISARMEQPGRLMEVGSGAGFFLKEAESMGWSCVGIEVIDAAVAFANDDLGLDVRKQAAEDLDMPEASFDVAVMLEVIEHLYAPRRALSAVRSSLAPGGLLVLSTPNFNSISRALLGSSWAVLSPAEHLYYFTRTSLQRLLNTEGFNQIEYVSPRSSLMRRSPPAASLRTHFEPGLTVGSYDALRESASGWSGNLAGLTHCS